MSITLRALTTEAGMFRVALLGVLVALAGPAQASNRCTGPDGRVSYQDAPCPVDAKASRQVALVDNTVEGRPYMPAQRHGGGAAASFDDAIRIKCGNDWPGNTRMQNHCMQRQVDAFRRSQGAISATPEVSATIRLRCEREWPDDYAMRAACQRVEARAVARQYR
jgi:hypothetical protein